MDYAINELQQEIINTAKEVAETVLKPLRAEADAKEQFSHEVVKAYQQTGLFGVWLPKEYGGLGGGVADLCLAIEQLSKACGGLALAPATSALGGMPMLMWSTK